MSPTCVTQPLLQQRFELAHILKAQVESLEAGNGGLAEIVAIELPHGKSNITLPGKNQITTWAQKIPSQPPAFRPPLSQVAFGIDSALFPWLAFQKVTSLLMGICPTPLHICLLEKVQIMRSWSWSIRKGLSLDIFGSRCSKESQTISSAALPTSMPPPQTLPTQHVHIASDTTPWADEAAHLCEPQFDSPLFESLSKLFQLLQVAGFLRCSWWS